VLLKAEAEAQQASSASLYTEGKSAYNQASQGVTMAQTTAAAAQQAPEGGYQPPTTIGRRMTLDDVVVKTGILFALLLVGAAFGWITYPTMPFLMFISMFVALGLGIWLMVKKQPSPGLAMGYAVVEGVFLGGISRWYQALGEASGNGNLVLTAVIATFVVFAVMLVAYKTGLIKVSARSRKIFTIMLFSYMGLALLSLVAALFGVGGGWGFFGMGPLGIIISLGAVALASYSLVIDFDSIVKTVEYGVDEKESWRMAFGLMVSLVWLYLEILRLLAILQRQ
jgi:uncharacterized YccA/Bax inhibitor family protein